MKLFKIAIFLLISHTSNAQWTDISLSNDENLYRIQMLSDSLGYVNSWTTLLKTENAGEKWDTVYHDSTIIDFHFLNSQTGFLIANSNQQNCFYSFY